MTGHGGSSPPLWVMDEFEPEYTVVSGSGHEDRDRELDQALLSLIGDVARARVLLLEATPREWALNKHRLEMLRSALKALPVKPLPQRKAKTMGFR